MSLVSGVADCAYFAASSVWSGTKGLVKTGATLASGATEIAMQPGQAVACFAGYAVGYAIGAPVGLAKGIYHCRDGSRRMDVETPPCSRGDNLEFHERVTKSIKDWQVSALELINKPLFKKYEISSISGALSTLSAMALTGAATYGLGLPLIIAPLVNAPKLLPFNTLKTVQPNPEPATYELTSRPHPDTGVVSHWNIFMGMQSTSNQSTVRIV
ncbi:hypothetical protein [Endozoicomonas sp.]|uniref:hypothetical protein n=1 Tax=Endozoicomonas sp. TaxID=1892382 RepID=UPI003AF82BA9